MKRERCIRCALSTVHSSAKLRSNNGGPKAPTQQHRGEREKTQINIERINRVTCKPPLLLPTRPSALLLSLFARTRKPSAEIEQQQQQQQREREHEDKLPLRMPHCSIVGRRRCPLPLPPSLCRVHVQKINGKN